VFHKDVIQKLTNYTESNEGKLRIIIGNDEEGNGYVYMQVLSHIFTWDKNNPCTGLESPGRSQEVQASRFQDNGQLMALAQTGSEENTQNSTSVPIFQVNF